MSAFRMCVLVAAIIFALCNGLIEIRTHHHQADQITHLRHPSFELLHAPAPDSLLCKKTTIQLILIHMYVSHACGLKLPNLKSQSFSPFSFSLHRNRLFRQKNRTGLSGLAGCLAASTPPCVNDRVWKWLLNLIFNLYA